MKLDSQTLERKIAVRANAEVNKAIKQFRLEVNAALRNLSGSVGLAAVPQVDPDWVSDGAVELLTVICKVQSRQWPAWLWLAKENAVRQELLSTMDAMQKVLLATAPGAGAEQPGGAAQPEPEAPPASGAVA